MNDKDNRTDRNKENIPAVPPGMWIKCTKCGKLIYRKELEKNKFICMKCGKYFRMPSENRILDIIDEGSFVELFTDVLDKNPIDFPGYSEKKEIIKKETNLEEAVITGKASIGHIEVMLGVCDTRYTINSDTDLVNQLGFESISLVELASVLSKETGVKVTHSQAIKWTTVKSILSTLAANSKDNNAYEEVFYGIYS